MRRVSRVMVAGSAGLLAASVLSGCGADAAVESDGMKSSGKSSEKNSARPEQSPAQVVQATNAKTTEAGSARVKMTATAQADGKSETVTGAGVIDLTDGTSRIELGQGGQRMEQRIVDQVLFQKPPQGSEGLPAGKTWTKVDLKRLRAAGGGNSSQVNDPADSLAYSEALSEKDVKKIGEERVGGVHTTHYRADVDLTKLSQGNPEQEKKLREQLGDTLPVDLWIDDKGLMRRQQVQLTIKAEDGAGSTEKATAKVVMDFSDFGAEVNVEAPAPADTADLTDKVISQGRKKV